MVAQIGKNDPDVGLSVGLQTATSNKSICYGEDGGEGGIRTPGTLARTSHFECDAIDHSATSPHFENLWSLETLISQDLSPCQPPFWPAVDSLPGPARNRPS